MIKKVVITGVLGAMSVGGVALGDARINPYEEKTDRYVLSVVSDIPQGERVDIAKDRAEITLRGWNDEYAITVVPQIPSNALGGSRDFVTEAKRPLLSKRMEYTVGDVTAFIEPVSDNEFDIDFTLKSKPDTNVFTYRIEGAEDFDFWYQLALTQEEIEQGAERPENVVGSYAVYHKTNRNHRVGSTNYTIGKAFHIYRPKAIDAGGVEVWAQLDYKDGILSVTVPQKFLDEAVYPVVVDPTFGYTTQGASQQDLSHDHAHTDYGRAIALKATLTESGEITKITSYITCVSEREAKAKSGIFEYSTSTGSVLTNGKTGEINVTTTGWKDMTFATNPTLSADDYFLITKGETKTTASYSDNTLLNYDTGGASGDSYMHSQGDTAAGMNLYDYYYITASTGTPEEYIVVEQDRKYSIYATYTASASAAPSVGTFYWGDE
jgi:hypothetical protein